MRLGWLTKNSITITMHFCLCNECKCLHKRFVLNGTIYFYNFVSTCKHYQGTDPEINQGGGWLRFRMGLSYYEHYHSRKIKDIKWGRV